MPDWPVTGLARLTLPFPQIAAGLGAFSLIATAGFFIQGERMHAWKTAARAHEQTLRNVAAEQERQNARIRGWAQSIEHWSREISDNADRTYQAGYADARGAAERYIAAHRVRAVPDRSGAIHAPSIAAPDGAEGGNRPGDEPELVAVTADDVRICTVNTQRLKAVRAWALDLEAQPANVTE